MCTWIGAREGEARGRGRAHRRAYTLHLRQLVADQLGTMTATVCLHVLACHVAHVFTIRCVSFHHTRLSDATAMGRTIRYPIIRYSYYYYIII